MGNKTQNGFIPQQPHSVSLSNGNHINNINRNVNARSTHNNVIYNNQIIINSNNHHQTQQHLSSYPVPNGNKSRVYKDDDFKEKPEDEHGGVRNKGTTNRSSKVSDSVILEFWRNNPSVTLLSVQKRFNAGYSRIKRLKQRAEHSPDDSLQTVPSSEDAETESISNSDCISSEKKEKAKKKKKDKKRKRRDSNFLNGSKAKKQCIRTDGNNFDISLFGEKSKRKRRAKWIQKTYKALEYLKKDISAYFFLKPVDKELCAAHDYDLVILQPMDFETLEKNLNNDKYSNIAEFVSDIELIFINAKIYNPPNHSVHRAAENLQKLFKSNFQAIIGEHGDDDTLNRWQYLDRPGGFAFGAQHQKNMQHATF